MVGVTKIQRGNAGYWLAAVAQGGEDYYTKPGEAPGEWVGDLADELGLLGQVDADAYGAILEGRDPISGAQLLQRPETRFRHKPDGSVKRVEPVLGYDIRFSAPKSVSLLYALGSERAQERIVAVMNEAVRQGIAHLEQQACMVQRGKGGRIIEPGQGFVGMAFRHRMSRAGDPALHVHVVISNLTRAGSDGKWLSLASPKGRSPLFPHGKSAGMVFQAALRAGFLREFGLEFEAVRNGYADLKGFSRELIESFSTRSREIAAWLQQHGVSSPKAAQTAAYRTRKPKDFALDADQRIDEWEAQAAPLGFTRQTVAAMITRASPREPSPVSEKAVSAAISQLERTSSHFDSRELLWAIADQLPEGADLPALTDAVDRTLGGEEIIRIYDSAGLLDPDIYTTPRIAELERRFIDGALQGADAGAAVVDRTTVEAVLARHDYLGADQREMVLRLAAGGEQVVTVAAWPGTGKTTALKATAEAWIEGGFPVFGCATARTATGELIDAGVRSSDSIASLRFQIEQRGRQLPEGSVLIVDEANVTSTFDLEALRAYVATIAGKLVLIGDPQQIGSIGPGGLFVHAARLLDAITLTEIRRQRREVDRQIVTLVHEGRGSDALDLLRTDGRLIVADDAPAALHGLLLDWHRDYATGADAVMIARRNRDVDYLNDQARELRRQEGKTGWLEVLVGERPIAAGDRVLTRINNREVSNRERWDVISVNPLARTVKLRRVGGDRRVVRVDRHYLNRRTPDGAPALQYAYAITKFGAESKTFDRAYALLDPGSTQNEELVALSRGREIATVYTVASSELLDPELGPGRRDVNDTLQDLREAIERDGADTAAVEQELRKRIEALPPKLLAERREQLANAARAADPLRGRRLRLDRDIARDRHSLESLAAEREATERLSRPPAEELGRLTAAEFSTAERIRRNEEERDALPDPPLHPPAPHGPQDRLEVALIEGHMARLVRAQVSAGRIGESRVIFDTLGPYPDDPALANAWNDAAHAIAAYRLRNDVHDPERPLGPEPKGAPARAERASAQRRLEAAQRLLRRGHEQAAERVAAKAPSIGR